MPWLHSGAEVGFENFYFIIFEADSGVTQSFDFPGDIVKVCDVHEYRFVLSALM